VTKEPSLCHLAHYVDKCYNACMFRLVLFILGAIVIIIASGIVYPVYALMKRINRHKADMIALHFVQWGFRFGCFLCGVTCVYKGLEYLPEDGDGVMYASNHRGLFDAILTYKAFKGRTGNLSKKELKKTPIIGWWIRSIYGVLLDRNDHKQGMQCVLECTRLLQEGISVLTYPEGTRGHVEGELLMFHKGTFKIATKAGARIIPVAINGTGDIFDDHRPYIRSHRAVVEFCEPIETKNLTREELENIHDIVRDIIQEKIRVNAAEVR